MAGPDDKGDLAVKPLDTSTWDAFADLVARDGGVWGGCWCLEFHPEGKVVSGYEERRAEKRRLVECGRGQAALVFDGGVCVGWCQFGPTEELPNIKSKKAYDSEAGEPPDWRITCFYTGKGHRGRGVADAALAGALELIVGLSDWEVGPSRAIQRTPTTGRSQGPSSTTPRWRRSSARASSPSAGSASTAGWSARSSRRSRPREAGATGMDRRPA